MSLGHFIKNNHFILNGIEVEEKLYFVYRHVIQGHQFMLETGFFHLTQ